MISKNYSQRTSIRRGGVLSARDLVLRGHRGKEVAKMGSVGSFSRGRVLLFARTKGLMVGKRRLRIGRLSLRGKRMSLRKGISDLACLSGGASGESRSLFGEVFQ